MLLLSLVFVRVYVSMCAFVGWSYNRAERRRTITKAQKGERERKMEKEKITHVLAIKDGLGLEEESHIADCCYDFFPSLLFLLSIDGSVYFTFVKNKENINMTRRRRRIVCRSAHTHTHILYLELRLLTESDDRRRVVFLFLFRLQRNECADAQDIFFFFFFSSSIVRSFGLVRKKREGEREKRMKNVGSHSSF